MSTKSILKKLFCCGKKEDETASSRQAYQPSRITGAGTSYTPRRDSEEWQRRRRNQDDTTFFTNTYMYFQQAQAAQCEPQSYDSGMSCHQDTSSCQPAP